MNHNIDWLSCHHKYITFLPTIIVSSVLWSTSIAVQCVLCAYVIIDNFILRNIILPKLLIHHNIMKMSFLCHFINGWNMTRTIFVEKFCFAFHYFVGYVLVHLFTCTQYSRHIPWDHCVTDITKIEIVTRNRTHLKSHTLYNCIVEEDLNIFWKLDSTSFILYKPFFSPSVFFNGTQLLILYGIVDSWMIMDHWWHDTNRGKTEALGKKPVTVPPCWPQILDGLAWDRTQASGCEWLATNHLSHDAVKISPK